MSTLRKQKASKKKADILRSTLNILSKKGYHGTTVEEVAAELMLTKGSVYYYFKSKEELIYQCNRLVLEESIEKVKATSNEHESASAKLWKAMQSHIEYAIQEKTLFMMMFQPETTFSGERLAEIVDLRDCYESYFDTFLKDGITEGDFVSLDQKISRMIILGSMNWVVEWFTHRGEKSSSEVAGTMSDYLLRMVRKGEGNAGSSDR
ncbi:AcrR family transcriptional regulator [Geomicrobium halophilum]|uniref:AcrR family transcriptional regulator n=1 Tax=Geomicrobium halophilum TaxID=549000 RepID=A0A841Q020_9BACL|nr:TetR/AcrR family transcriptional regulator [Geomicrobium halophilum]MBB6448548.1 AcrR family transcriptional regulator [Geomicrobium halophilum]